MTSTAGSLRFDEFYDHQHEVTRHPDNQVTLLPFFLKVVILGDDVIGVREVPSYLERNSMVPRSLRSAFVGSQVNLVSIYSLLYIHA
jgi:hypothetical protein